MTEERTERVQSPQDKAKLEALKRSWAQKREVTDRLSHIKAKIGVYSGKGGVGKTTVAVNLAVTLAQKGYLVGLMDADIDCPNVAKVIAATQPSTHEDGKFIPAVAFGVKVMSMSFFQQNEEEAIIWRGPMVHNAINQFLQTTDWGELDFLVVDLPPGTSDAPLTVMQTMSLDGFIVVTTPQALAKLDAKRSLNMIRKLNVNILGIVENMSGDIFGSGAGEELAKEVDTPFLGRLDLRREYRDGSRPTVLVNKKVAQEYDQIIGNVLPHLEALAQPVG